MNWAKVGDLCDLVNGKAFKPSDWSNAGVPIIRIQNLNGAEKPFNYWSGPLDRQVKVRTGDVLLAWSGTPGTSFGVHIWDRDPGILNQHIFRVDLNRKKITPRWFMYAVNGQLNKLIAKAHGGVGLQHVTRPMVDSLEIPLPALDEQQRIAAVLDKANALLRKRRRSLDLLDGAGHAIFFDMFGDARSGAHGYDVRPVGEICQLINGAAFKPADWTEEGKPIIRIQNLNDPSKSFNFTRRILPEKLWIMPGDYLFSWSGTPGTSFGCFKWSGPPGWLNQHIFKVSFADCVIGTFFQYQMNARIDELIAKAHGGVGLQHVTKGMINEMPFICPPKRVQEQFVSRIEKLTAVRSKTERGEQASKALFSSLQHRAFSGQL